MTKPETAALLLSGVGIIAGLFAAFESHRTSDSLASLEQRLSRLETPVAAGVVPPAGPSNADLARELGALRSQVASISSRPSVGTATPGVKDPPVADHPPVVDAASAEDAERRRLILMDGMAKGVMNTLVEKIGLTDQQGTQVREIVVAQVTAWQKTRRSVPEAGLKQAVDEFLKDTNEKIKVCLTPEQQVKYDELTKGPNGIFGVRALGATINPPYQPGDPR
ncbi:MAG: hypothetical protein K8T20_07440 [Planctomycetes bacterium]|nr:hypothetical protein [Planctomycetota bacterium]